MSWKPYFPRRLSVTTFGELAARLTDSMSLESFLEPWPVCGQSAGPTVGLLDGVRTVFLSHKQQTGMRRCEQPKLQMALLNINAFFAVHSMFSLCKRLVRIMLSGKRNARQIVIYAILIDGLSNGVRIILQAMSLANIINNRCTEPWT